MLLIGANVSPTVGYMLTKLLEKALYILLIVGFVILTLLFTSKYVILPRETVWKVGFVYFGVFLHVYLVKCLLDIVLGYEKNQNILAMYIWSIEIFVLFLVVFYILLLARLGYAWILLRFGAIIFLLVMGMFAYMIYQFLYGRKVVKLSYLRRPLLINFLAVELIFLACLLIFIGFSRSVLEPIIDLVIPLMFLLEYIVVKKSDTKK